MSLLRDTLDLIRDNQLHLRRQLGQNFLVDENVLNKIVAQGEFSRNDVVLEIGTGFGFLTRTTAGLVKKIFTFEIDHGVAAVAREVLKNSPNVKLLEEDFLEFPLSELKLKEKIKVTGNLPYNISSPIMEKIFENRRRITAGYFLVQKEFADRITAVPGTKNYSSFSIFCQYHAGFQKLFSVSRHCFMPRPEVDSVFIKMTLLRRPPVLVVDEKIFFNIIRGAFSQRRKTLQNALTGSAHLKVSEIRLRQALTTLKLNPMIRGENLGLEEFAGLANLLAQN